MNDESTPDPVPASTGRRRWWRRPRWIAAGLAVIAVATVGVVAGWNRWSQRCAASYAEVSADDLARLTFVPPEQADLSGIGDRFRSRVQVLLDAAKQPGAPLGRSRGVMVAADKDGGRDEDVRVVGSHGGDPLLAVGPAGLPGSSLSGAIVMMDPADGKARWAREFGGYRVGGGDAGDQFISLQIPRKRAPQAAAIALPDGDLQWCATLGRDVTSGFRPSFASDSGPDSSLYVVRPSDAPNDDGVDSDDEDVRLSRLDRGDGDLRWDTPVRGLTQADSVDSFGDLVLVSSLRSDMLPDDRRKRLRGERWTRDLGSVWAMSAADGSVRWKFGGPDAGDWINNVVGVHEDVAVVAARGDLPDGPGDKPDRRVFKGRTRLVGVGLDGKQRWALDTGHDIGYRIANDAVVEGELLLTVEGTGKEQRVLVAREVATGRERWRTRLPEGRPDLLKSARVGNTLLVAPQVTDPLDAFDLRTGKASRPLGSAAQVHDVRADAESVTVTGNGLIMTFDRLS